MNFCAHLKTARVKFSLRGIPVYVPALSYFCSFSIWGEQGLFVEAGRFGTYSLRAVKWHLVNFDGVI